MSKVLRILCVLAIAATGCGARAPRDTSPVRYVCGDTQVVRTGEKLTIHGARHAPTTLGWRDGAGDHFVAWPRATTDVEAIEYVFPADHRKDAIQNVHDASKGYSSSDWRLISRRTCRAEGGYNDALARFMDGASMDELARQFAMNESDARRLVRKALLSLQQKYLRDR